MLAKTQLDEEIAEELNRAGFNVKDVRSRKIPRDGTEQRGFLREGVDLVRNLLVFCGNECDEDTASALTRAVFAILHARRRSGQLDDVEYVNVYGSDNKSVLMQVPIPRSSVGGLTSP